MVKKMNIGKKVLFTLFALLMCSLPCLCIEETTENLEPIELNKLEESLKEKIEENINKDVEKTKKTFHSEAKIWSMFGTNGYEFESGLVKNFKVNGYFRFDNAMTAKRDTDFSSLMTFDSVELQTETLFRDNKTKLSASYNFVRDLDYDNNFFEKVSNLYIDHDFNENQKIRIGNARVPCGIEGGMSSSAIKFVTRGQISRNFGDARSVGVRNMGKYKYLDYDIGFYDSSRFMQKLFQGQEFAAIASVKPLAKYGDKYGKLKIGSSIDVGDADKHYAVFGAHAIYEYKNFYWDFEYANANNSGGKYIKTNDAHGFFTTLAYKITPKIEVLARYDYFKNRLSDKRTQEYTAGLNYYFNPHCKAVANYVIVMNSNSTVPTHKIYLGARFMTSSLLGDI